MPVSTSMPDVVVEIAFTTDPGDPAPSWTDVSAYVEAGQDGGPITINRGRSDELGEIQPSTMTVTLDNTDGRFTAGLTTGANYPNVTLGRRIRVRETWSAVTYYRFDGFVTEWPTVWPDGAHTKSTVTVTATSRMASLSRRQPLRSIVEQEYLQDTASFYWMMNEASEAVNASSSIPADQITRLTPKGSGTAYTFGDATGPTTDGYTALAVTGGKYLGRTFTNNVCENADEVVAVEMAFATSSTSAGTLFTLATDNDFAPNYLYATVTFGGFIRLRLANTLSAFTYDNTGATNVMDGNVHHLFVSYGDRGNDGDFWTYVYVDGVLEFSVLHVTGLGGTSILSRHGWFSVGGGIGTPFEGSIAHVAIYKTSTNIPTAARIANHAEAALTGFAGELASERIERLAGYADIDPAFLALEAGVATVDNQFTEGADILALMQQAARTEAGVLFDGGDGTLVFHGRQHRDGAASAITLSVTTGEVEANLTAKLDDQGVTNDVTVTSGDDSVRVVDQDGIDTYGVYTASFDVVTDDDEALQDWANYQLSRYSTPRVRFPSLATSVNTVATSQVPLLLALEIGDRVTFTTRPTQAPDSPTTFFVEGYTEAIGAETYTIEFNLSPANLSDVWILNNASYSQLDQTTVLGL